MVQNMFFDIGDIQAMTGWSQSTIRRRVKDGYFPAPINQKLYGAGSRKALQWLRSDVMSWTASQ